MFPITPTQLVLKLAESQVLSPLQEAYAPIIDTLQEKAENHPAYTALWDAMPADLRPELSHLMVQITGLLADAFLAGLLSAYLPQED